MLLSMAPGDIASCRPPSRNVATWAIFLNLLYFAILCAAADGGSDDRFGEEEDAWKGREVVICYDSTW